MRRAEGYGRWIFQGIADSVRDGFYAGASFKTLDSTNKITHINGAQHKAVIPEKVIATGTGRVAAIANGGASRLAGQEAVTVKK